MSTAKIVTQIDAYLLCLRQARGLLDSSEEIARRRHALHKRAVVKTTEATPVPSKEAHIQQVKVQRKAVQRKNNAANMAVDMVAAPDAVAAVEISSFQPEAAVPQSSVEKDVKLFAERKHTNNMARQKNNQWEQVVTSQRTKLVNAISGSALSKVVVVSAEEVRKAREQAAHPIVKTPRISVAGLSGRKAFEALFNDESNSAATPTA
jgi:hypothetical protein